MTDPSVGVWISEDGELGAPDPTNLYRYVGDNPVNEVDPSGLSALEPAHYRGRITAGRSKAELYILFPYGEGERDRTKREGEMIRKRTNEAIRRVSIAYDSLVTYEAEFLASNNFGTLQFVKNNINFYKTKMREALEYLKNPDNTINIDVFGCRPPGTLIRDWLTGGTTIANVKPWTFKGNFNMMPGFFDLNEEDQIEVLVHELFGRALFDLSSNDYLVS